MPILTPLFAATKVDRPGFRPYRASVTRVAHLSTHFVRVTFSSPQFDMFGTDGLDQRIKIIFPLEGHDISDFGVDHPQTIAEGDWYSRWRQLPDEQRNPLRTYTVRSARPQRLEVDVDMVRHTTDDGGESSGPASRWLGRVQVGDEVAIMGPDAGSIHSAGGIDWQPGEANQLLLAGDETAAPAIGAILESLPEGSTAHAFIEVPVCADRLAISVPDGCALTWLSRGDHPVGTALEAAVRGWVADNIDTIHPALSLAQQHIDEIDIETELLWDSPAAAVDGHFYAWLAGEAAAMKSLRRFLVGETGIDRKRIAFMGYWRHGRAELQ